MLAVNRASRGAPAGWRCSAPPLALAVAALLSTDASALLAPNVVVISPGLVTSGQPSDAELRKLAAEGFDAVVYLAPATGTDDGRSEAEIVRAQGLEFVSIPIVFNHPTGADFARFAEAMRRLEHGKILVHCQINQRASTMTFLYRTIVGGEPPEQAYDAVARVWSPSPAVGNVT